MELEWEASLEMGGCSILLDGIPSSMENVLRKMEHVQLDDNENVFFSFTLSTKVQVFTLGLGEKVFSFLTALVLFFIF